MAAAAAQNLELKARLTAVEQAYDGLLQSVSTAGGGSNPNSGPCACSVLTQDESTWEETIAALDRQLENM